MTAGTAPKTYVLGEGVMPSDPQDVAFATECIQRGFKRTAEREGVKLGQPKIEILAAGDPRIPVKRPSPRFSFMLGVAAVLP